MGQSSLEGASCGTWKGCRHTHLLLHVDSWQMFLQLQVLHMKSSMWVIAVQILNEGQIIQLCIKHRAGSHWRYWSCWFCGGEWVHSVSGIQLCSLTGQDSEAQHLLVICIVHVEWWAGFPPPLHSNSSKLQLAYSITYNGVGVGSSV